MKQKMRKKVTISFVLLCVIMVCCMSFPSMAYANTIKKRGIDLDANTSLSLKYLDGETPISGVEFSIYQVATFDEYGALVKTEDFKEVPTEYNFLQTHEEWFATAETVKRYVIDKNGNPNSSENDLIHPIQTGSTSYSGSLTFQGTSTQKMSTGLYLVVGESKQIGDYEYRVAPFLMALPNTEKNADGSYSFEYQVTVYIKFDKENTIVPNPDPTPTPDPDPNTGSLSVIKRWNDEGYEEERPDAIHVNLYQDGIFIDSKELNEDNYWRHTWTGLEKEGEWTVVETGVSGSYIVTYTDGESEFIIDNTYVEEIDDNETPGVDRPDGEAPDNPSQPNGGEDIEDNEIPGGSFEGEPDDSNNGTPIEQMKDPDIPKGKLPQTGLLQWPIPVMASLGLILFLIGWIRHNKGEE